MKAFVFWTGLISVFAGISFQFQFFSLAILPFEAPGALVHVFGLMAVFLGIMLLICSRDLKNRGVFVAWEGVLRIVVAVVMIGYGTIGGLGIMVIASGIFDGAIGVAYLIALPLYLSKSLVKILMDRY